MSRFLRAVLVGLLFTWVGVVFSQGVEITGSSSQRLRSPVLIKRQGTSPVLTVQLKASEADVEANELHRKILIALREVYEERFFPLDRQDDGRIQQPIRCSVVVMSDSFGASFEVRCGRRFPRQIFVGTSYGSLSGPEIEAVAKHIPKMLEEIFGLALKLPE